MKITHIETIPVLVPIRRQFVIHSSQGAHDASPFLLVKVCCDSGHIGIGEASCTLLWSGEDHHTAARCIAEVLGPALIGEDPRDISHLSQRMDALLKANSFTKSAIEMALWDILGKSAELPLYRLFGGARQTAVPIKFSISGCLPEKAAEIGVWAVEQGFRTLKVKVGIADDQDIARVAAVRGAVGPGVRLGVDANGGWTTQQAIEIIRKLELFDIYFAEQPVRAGNIQEMAAVRTAVSIPIIADESLFHLTDSIGLVSASAVDVFSIYVGKGGGLGGARKMAAVAEAAGICCTVGSNLELGIGSAAMTHLAAATDAVDAERFPCDIIGPFYYEAELLRRPLNLTSGCARTPDGPGLGVELNEDAVSEYRVRA